MTVTIPTLLGLSGTTMIALCYFGIQTRKISPASTYYSGINALGAALIMVSLYYQFNLSAFLMELFWFVTSIYGMFYSRRISKVAS